MNSRTCYVYPIGKPRMTRRDKWAKRPAVLKYRIFADALRTCMEGIDLSDVIFLGVVAYLPFPASYGAKKREALAGKPHREKPDFDNVLKAVADALVDEDKGIALSSFRKYWEDDKGPRLEITID
jgi:Holliday junction resolvase RusA-like endonuclease